VEEVCALLSPSSLFTFLYIVVLLVLLLVPVLLIACRGSSAGDT